MFEDPEVPAEAPAEEVAEAPAEVTPEAPAEESVEEVKARLAKAEELANNYKVRAEKAEKKAKEPAPQQDGLSSKDVIYLAKTDIHSDDVDEVLDIARARKWDVKQAHEYLKPILAVRAEQRATAAAANTSNVRRGNAKVTDESLLSNAAAGKLPENDDDIERLVAAKLKRK